MKKIISVAMATYNGERFLREQLDSLYGQTMIPDEIVVSDDGSTDNTLKILASYHEKYGLKYIVHDKKIGVNKNFEVAIRACSGDYIAICDQDDIWFPEKIQISYEKIREIENDAPAMVSSQPYHINSEGELISKGRHINKDSKGAAATLLYPPGVTQGCSLMFNRKLLGLLKEFPQTNDTIYDSYIGFVCASIGIKYNMAMPLMYYRHHSNNAVASNATKKDNLLRKLKSSLKYYFNPSCISKKRLLSLALIEKEYGELFTSEVSALYKKISEYREEKSKYKKIRIVWSIKELELNRKLNWTIGLIINKE